MELNILFQHSITSEDGVIESVVCAEFDGHLRTMIKRDVSKVLPEDCHGRYQYFVGDYFAKSDKDIDIVEALKENIGLKNNSTTIDPDFYFDHY
jgi:hypothetical protein